MDLWAGMSFFPRKSYLRALRIDCPFIAFLHFLGGLKSGKRSTQGSVDHRVETDNKPHLVMFSITSDCFETVGALEVAITDSGAMCEMNLLIISCLAFWKTVGSLDKARDLVRRAAGHEAWQ